MRLLAIGLLALGLADVTLTLETYVTWLPVLNV